MTIFHEKNYQLFFFLFHYYWLNKFLRNVKIYSGAPPTATWMGFSIVKLCIAKSYKWFLDFAKYNNFTSKSSQTKLRFLFYPRMNHLLKAFFMTEKRNLNNDYGKGYQTQQSGNVMQKQQIYGMRMMKKLLGKNTWRICRLTATRKSSTGMGSAEVSNFQCA